jgi:hypothetical protein
MTPRIVCLNGPPRCGKDTAAGFLEAYGWTELKLSEPLKYGLACIFGVSPIEMETDKEIKRDELLGMSWREAQIWLSEEAMKPKLGKFVFAKLLARKIQASRNEKFVLSDCGFQTEYDYLTASFGVDNVRVIQLLRENTSFKNDSREWVFASAYGESIRNDGTLAELQTHLSITLRHWDWL